MILQSLFLEILGGTFRNLWPLLVLPAALALAARLICRALPIRPWTALPAALLTIAPGVLMLALLYSPVRDILGEVVIQSWRGVVLWILPPCLAAALVLRATVRQLSRARLIRNLVDLSVPAGPSLRPAAAAAGLSRVRELPGDHPSCFVAGAFRPIVYVSHGAVERLTAAQLRAALLHEQAHVRGRDSQLLGLLSWFADLSPVRPSEALRAFQLARELRADRHAARQADTTAIAEAILAIARVTPGSALVMGLSSVEMAKARLGILLGAPMSARLPLRRGLAAGAAAIAVCMLLAFPLLQTLGLSYARSMNASADRWVPGSNGTDPYSKRGKGAAAPAMAPSCASRGCR